MATTKPEAEPTTEADAPWPQVKIRMHPAMKERAELEAAANSRSVQHEIISILADKWGLPASLRGRGYQGNKE
jgi:hypothetical protein